MLDAAGQPAALDFVTARMEFYEHPTALPEVERSSIKQDLHRRDFTINTLAIPSPPDHYGEVLDFYGGESDLRQGLIRVLHSLSFVEDPTRILRAVRLEQRMGFRIESRTLELLQHALDLLDRVSGERIFHELHLILREPEPERALRRSGRAGCSAPDQPGVAGRRMGYGSRDGSARWLGRYTLGTHSVGRRPLPGDSAPSGWSGRQRWSRLISRLRIPGYEARYTAPGGTAAPRVPAPPAGATATQPASTHCCPRSAAPHC